MHAVCDQSCCSAMHARLVEAHERLNAVIALLPDASSSTVAAAAGGVGGRSSAAAALADVAPDAAKDKPDMVFQLRKEASEAMLENGKVIAKRGIARLRRHGLPKPRFPPKKPEEFTMLNLATKYTR